jgi:nitroreductase
MTKLLKLFQFLLEYVHDLWIFLRFNGYSPLVDERIRAYYKIVIETHTIEKGLSLPEPRTLFGKEKIAYVMAALDRYSASRSTFPAEMGVGALRSYLEHHRNLGVSNSFLDQVAAFVERWQGEMCTIPTGGVKGYRAWLDATSGPEWLLISRSSVRMLSPAPLRRGLIEEVVRLAQKAPSQCNRQATKVHAYQRPDQIQSLLALQGGSKGFSRNVGNLLVVSSEIAAWGGPGQRNQPFVDGGLFAMSLLSACHVLGLGACPLNLAVTNARENQIRKVGEIPAGERLVMMIAMGIPLEGELRVASSPRRNVQEVLRLHAGEAAR